jgi:4-amino-4-deoxy-L-arabinose transferase-like glycosyltransferase
VTPARAMPWAVLAVALAVAGTIVVETPVTTWRPQADEGYYLLYARRVADDGPRAFPDLFREYLQDPVARRLFPSPIRVTTISLGALAVRLGGASMPSLAHVSLAAFLALLVLAFVATRQAFGDWTACCTTLLLAVSPLHLAMARRALGDSLSATLALTCLGLCLHALGSNRRWWLVSAAYATALLARELNLVLIPISLALVACHWWRRRPAALPIAAAAHVSIVPLALAACVAALAAGGFGPAWEAFSGTVRQPAANAYALAYGAGPWFRYYVDALLLSPWPPLLYLAWLGWLAATRPADERLWAWALVPLLFVACTAPFPKFVRWALPLDAPFRLATVLFLERVLRGTSPRAGRAMVAVAVVALMAVDVAGFHRLFVVGDIYDPTTALLAASRKLIP